MIVVIPSDSSSIEKPRPSYFYCPNAFSPNGDGINDVFNPIVEGNLDFELQIFNRWGNLIYQQNNLGWDGYYNGKYAKDDVYVWKIKLKNIGSTQFQEYYGHVTLIK